MRRVVLGATLLFASSVSLPESGVDGRVSGLLAAFAAASTVAASLWARRGADGTAA